MVELLYVLAVFLLRRLLVLVRLQPGLSALELVEELGHVDDQVLDHALVPLRADADRVAAFGGGIDLGLAGEHRLTVDLHGAGAADRMAAGHAEGEGAVLLPLDGIEGIEHGLTRLDLKLE